MKNLILLFFSLIIAISCNKNEEVTKEKSTDSIFYLDSKWQNQDGKTLQLQDLKGKNLVVVMIFTSCKTACPLLVTDIKNI